MGDKEHAFLENRPLRKKTGTRLAQRFRLTRASGTPEYSNGISILTSQ
jgi:hypothetical protein